MGEDGCRRRGRGGGGVLGLALEDAGVVVDNPDIVELAGGDGLDVAVVVVVVREEVDGGAIELVVPTLVSYIFGLMRLDEDGPWGGVEDRKPAHLPRVHRGLVGLGGGEVAGYHGVIKGGEGYRLQRVLDLL